MIDQSSIDLVALINQTTPLRKRGQTYRARCPFHGGKSETSLNVFQGRDGYVWNCFVCGGGDSIAWVQHRDGCSFSEALTALGLSGESPPVAADPAVVAPESLEPPSSTWQDAAAAFVEDSFTRLYGAYPKPLTWLHGRGFTPQTISGAVLGYNDDDHDVPRATWGLPPERDDRGRERRIWLPRGIVIPWFVGGVLWRIYIRTPQHRIFWNDTERWPKYYQVPGSGNALYNADKLTYGRPAILTEAALDALAIEQSVGDLITPVASGTTGARHLRWISALALARPLLLSFDQDSGGVTPTSYWQSIFPRAHIWRAYYDDPAAMLRDGGDDTVRSWIVDGLGVSGERALPKGTPREHMIADLLGYDRETDWTQYSPVALAEALQGYKEGVLT